jgi:hypothetical protein
MTVRAAPYSFRWVPAAFTGAPFREELRSRDDIADDFRCVRDE